MLRFFRKMRKALVPENRFGRYFFYAIGEIVLVVIGILIALQINNWNTHKKDRLIEKQYLEKFKTEMVLDSLWLNGYWSSAYPRKVKGLTLARNYVKHSMDIKDTIELLNTMGVGGIASRTALFETTSTYNDIISTGNLKLITNPELQSQILNYYGGVSNTRTYLNNLRSEYATFFNSQKPFDPSSNFKPDSKDLNRALIKLRSDEFLGLANQELTFAFAMNRRMESQKEHLMIVLELVKSELNNFK